jgi:hypothetical protein
MHLHKLRQSASLANIFSFFFYSGFFFFFFFFAVLGFEEDCILASQGLYGLSHAASPRQYNLMGPPSSMWSIVDYDIVIFETCYPEFES